MKICILSRNRNLYSTRRLIEAAREQGHEVSVIDVLRCYMNITMNRPITATGPVPAASATRLTQIWATPTDARDWVVDVVGENIATTCDTCRADT